MADTSSISGLDVLTNAQTSGKDSASSKTKLFDDMEAFLYLLTQQLKYQDPLGTVIGMCKYFCFARRDQSCTDTC